MRRLLKILAPAALAFAVATPVFASTVNVEGSPTLQIYADGASVGSIQFSVGEDGTFIGDFQTIYAGSDTIYLYGLDGNVDPFVNFAVGVIDSGAPSIFTFVFSVPIAPIAGLVNYTLDLAGSFSNGSPNNGGSLSMAAPNTLGVLEGRFNGTTSIDGIGGPAAFPAFVSSTYGPFASAGSYDCSLLGGCSSMEARLSFLGSGGIDAFGFTGRFEITPVVPVPAAAWLFGSALGVLGYVRRRAR